MALNLNSMFVYKITNKINNKLYVGQTIRAVEERWREHCKKTSDCSAIANAIQKHGKENFTIEVLYTASSIEELNTKEQEYISDLNTLRPNGYNLTTGGLNHTCSEETSKKRSERQIGEKNHNWGKKASLETRAKMSNARKGEKNHFFGKTHTLETSKKLSEMMKVRGNLQLGRKRSDESRKKMSVSHKGIPAVNRIPIKCNETSIVYASITEACKALSLTVSEVAKHLKGKRKTCKNYTFSYV